MGAAWWCWDIGEAKGLAAARLCVCVYMGREDVSESEGYIIIFMFYDERWARYGHDGNINSSFAPKAPLRLVARNCCWWHIDMAIMDMDIVPGKAAEQQHRYYCRHTQTKSRRAGGGAGGPC